MKLHDLCNLIHPKSEAIDKLMKGTLPSIDTWETQLSAGADKKETFEKLMAENQLGGKAFLMNVRNMLQAGVDEQLMANYATSMNSSMLFPIDVMKAFFSAIDAGITIGRKLTKSLEDLAIKLY